MTNTHVDEVRVVCLTRFRKCFISYVLHIQFLNTFDMDLNTFLTSNAINEDFYNQVRLLTTVGTDTTHTLSFEDLYPF